MTDIPLTEGSAEPDVHFRWVSNRALDEFAATPEGAVHELAAFGEMAGGIAHDFRNILTIIEAGLRLAERNAAEPELARDFIAGAREGIGLGMQLVAKITGFALHQDMGVRPANLNDLLRNLELFLKYGVEPRLHVVMELSHDIPSCLIDAAQFNAAIVNLVVNARDAAVRGGEVVISTERCVIDPRAADTLPAGVYVRVRVSDNGEGMSDEVMQQVFDTFFTTKGARGTGLGLPQVCALMRLVGGYVRMASRPGEGTTLDLFFPSVLSLRTSALAEQESATPPTEW